MVQVPPPMLLLIETTDIQEQGYWPDDGSQWANYAFQWTVSLAITPQQTSYPPNFFFTGTDVLVGDWMSNATGGYAWIIREITSQDAGSLVCVVEDVGQYNTYLDQTGNGAGAPPFLANGFIFRLDERNQPILSPVVADIITPQWQTDLMGRFATIDPPVTTALRSYTHDTNVAGEALTLQADGTLKWVPTDSFTGTTVTPDGLAVAMGGSSNYTGAVTFQPTTHVTNAIESLNSILSHLVPTAPNNFPTANFTLVSTGSLPVLAAGGVSDHTSGASGLSPGNSVTRLTSSTITTSTLTLNNQSPNGLAADLALTLKVNGATSTSYSFTDVTPTGTGDNGSHSGITIASQAAYPSGTPGFWKSFSVQASGALSSQGINSLQLTSNIEGNSNTLYWVQDNITASPAISGPSLTLASNGTLAYSSSVPHFGTGASLTGRCSISNLAGETYYSGTPLSVSGTNGVVSTQSYSYATLGITTPIQRQTTAATQTSTFTISVNGTNLFTSGTISATATNVNGTGSGQLASIVILAKNGTYTAIDELNVAVSGHGSLPNTTNAVRVVITGDGTGVDTPASLAYTAWNSTTTLASYAAAVVAGSLSCNQTNYATGYLPVGPNLSGRDTAQYVTFMFQRSAMSNFVINVTGTYAHCWIGLLGISDNHSISPNAKNGAWWDTAVAYQGVGVPGDASNPNAGCASNTGSTMTGSSGAFSMTFGTQSSSNATSNTVLVRFRLNTGQAITALSFT